MLVSGALGAGTTTRVSTPIIFDTTLVGKAVTTCATTGLATDTIGAATASPTLGPNSRAITKEPAAATLTPLVIVPSIAISSASTFLTRPRSDPPHPFNAIASRN